MLQRPVVDRDGVVQNGSRQRSLKRVVALKGVHEVREGFHHVLEGVVVEDLALVEVGDDVVGHGGDVVDDLHIRAEVELRELDDLLLNGGVRQLLLYLVEYRQRTVRRNGVVVERVL